MCNINAAFGLSQIEYLNKLIGLKLNIARVYDSAFADITRFTVMPRLEWSEGSYIWLYSLRTKNKNESLSLIKHLKEINIESKLFWNSLSSQEPYKQYNYLLNGISESLSGSIVSLPCSTSLTESEQERVIDAVRSWSKTSNYLKD